MCQLKIVKQLKDKINVSWQNSMVGAVKAQICLNKANLGDLIAVSGLEIFLKIAFKSTIFFTRITLKFDVWSRKRIGHLLHTTSSFVNHFRAIGEFKLELQSGNARFGSKSAIVLPVWPQDGLENNMAPLLYYNKLCTSFQSHQWIQTGVKIQKRSILVKISNFFCHVWPWKIWWMTFENNMAPLLCYLKLCASFYSHLWIQTWVTVRKPPFHVKIDDFF